MGSIWRGSVKLFQVINGTHPELVMDENLFKEQGEDMNKMQLWFIWGIIGKWSHLYYISSLMGTAEFYQLHIPN